MSNDPTFENLMSECNVGKADLKVNSMVLSFDQSISLDAPPLDKSIGLYVGNYTGLKVQLMYVDEFMGEVSINTCIETGGYHLTKLPKDLFFKVFTRKK